MSASLPELAETLSEERDALIVSAAALQLLPQNATKWMRFERLVEACSAVATGAAQRDVSIGRLRQLLTSAPVVTSQIIAAEDPFEESFTAEVTFYGGSFTVVTGGASSMHSACQQMLEAVRRADADSISGLRDAIYADATVLLTLSNEMCRRAGLGRWLSPEHSASTPLRVPSAAEFNTLRSAVRFSPTELVDLLGPMASHVDDLVAPSPIPITDHDAVSPTDDRPYLYPLLRLTDGSVAVAIPGALAGSLVHRGLAGAVDAGVADDVVALLRDNALSTAAQFLSRLRWLRVATPSGLDSPNSFGEAFWQFDIDKVAHVVTVVDPLDGYRAGDPFGSVGLTGIEEDLAQRLLAVRTRKSDMGASEILHIVCSTVLGRTWFLGFSQDAVDESSALLALSLDDLDILTGLEPADPLALWKFARASTALHERCRVMSFSKLDEFAVYRGHSDGFYLSDDGIPDMITVEPGTGAGLRVRERQRRDPHAVELPARSSVVEVSRWAADDATPIYQPHNPKFHAHHVVELSLPCWVVPNPADGDLPDGSEDLAEAIAFWLWRCRSELSEPLRRLRDGGAARVLVRARLEAQTEDDSCAERPSTWLSIESEPVDARLDVTLLNGAAKRMRGPTNDAERALAGALVESIHALTAPPAEGFARRITDSLPPGPMKMLHVFGDEDDPFLLLGYTAQPRLVSRADIEVVLDEVGEICSSTLGLKEGPIDDDDRTRVLNGVVAELFQRMGRSIARLQPDGLIEHLAAEQEAIAYLEARDRLLVTSQIACFGKDSSAARHAADSSRRLTSTSVANRFLLEYVTAVPPSGITPLSVDAYDRILAYATEIIEFGYLSDAIRYGLSASNVSILPSGRLGSSRKESYYETVRIFSQLASVRSVEAARRAFSRHWAVGERDESEFDPEPLNAAFFAEFNITASEHALLTGELVQMSRDVPRQVATWDLDELVSHLHDSLGWPSEKATEALSLLALGPLDQFPPATNSVDSYPWRYSRNRSAARRPLNMRPRDRGDGSVDGVDVVWGPRSVYRSSRYLIEQIVSGRLKCQSPEMQRFITDSRREGNDDFNRQVAAHFRQTGYEDVRENVKKLGPIRLQRANGDDIGDIDVFVIDRANRVLLAAEVKDFEFARTPFELSNELDKLFGEKDSAIAHHEERLAFLKRNLAAIVEVLALTGRASDWQVHGLVVTSADLMGAHFPQVLRTGPKLKILSFEQLATVAPRTLTARRGVDRSTRSDRRKRRRKRGR